MNFRGVSTICPYCGCGCGMILEVLDGELIDILPNKSNPVNKGELCIKGWNAHDFVISSERISRPLIRRNDDLKEVSWEEVLDYTSLELKRIKDQYGSDSIAFFSSAKCTNEENYLLQKFARAVIKTNNIDHCARL
jgi:predicted molibdopterin-dependent oxidoreductase YjgC